ncbi:MAG: cell division protein SepF [Acidimicrobiales bacterium]|jgi:cell division inhibitor SepF
MLKKVLIQLGLGDDADYEQYHVDGAAPQPDRGESAPRAASSGPSAPEPLPDAFDEPSALGEVRPISTRGQLNRDPLPMPSAAVMPTPVPVPVQPTATTPAGVQGVGRPRTQVVRPVPITANSKPHVVVPASFNQAQDVADKFKTNQPVVMNLQGADRDLSRRLIDFASGLCYGLGGQMERLVNQVYLLTPGNVEVSADERRRLEERGYEP